MSAVPSQAVPAISAEEYERLEQLSPKHLDEKAARRHRRAMQRISFENEMEAYQEDAEADLLRSSARHSRSLKIDDYFR